MLRHARMTPALRALGALLLVAGLLAGAHQVQAASQAPRDNAGGPLLTPAQPTQSPEVTKSPAATHTVERTVTRTTTSQTKTPAPTDTPIPTHTPTNTPTSTATNTATNTPTNTPGPPKTHTPSPANTGTVQATSTGPASTVSPESTVLGAEQPPAGIVLPATGSNGSGGSNAMSWVAAFGLIAAGLALLTMTSLWKQRR